MTYEITFWGETRTYEARSERGAINDFLMDLKSEVENSAEINEINVFEVPTVLGTVGVLGKNEIEARRNARDHFQRKLERAREESDLNQDAKDILMDLNFSVQGDIEEANRDTYEIDRDGYWNEGEL